MRLLIFAVISAASVAQATSFLARPFSDSVQGAPVIVRGNIGNQIYSDWVVQPEDGTKRLYTFFELRITEVLKGRMPPAGDVFFRQLGGEKNGIGMNIPGSAEFKRGEDVVVFLNPKNPDGSYDLLSLMMGKYEVHKEDGETYLTGPGITEESGVVGDHDHEGQNGSGPVKKWTLEAVRKLVHEQGGRLSETKPQPSPSVTIAPVKDMTPSVLPAPALQSQEAGPSSETSGSKIWLYIALGIVVLLLGWYIKK